MENKKLKTRLFGYSKKGVTAYVDTIITQYEDKIKELSEHSEKQKRENQTLMEENKELFVRISELEREREFISRAVIAAEEKAQKILDDANTAAEQMKNQTFADLEETRNETEALREQIKTLKLKAVAAIRKYETQLDEI